MTKAKVKTKAKAKKAATKKKPTPKTETYVYETPFGMIAIQAKSERSAFKTIDGLVCELMGLNNQMLECLDKANARFDTQTDAETVAQNLSLN